MPKVSSTMRLVNSEIVIVNSIRKYSSSVFFAILLLFSAVFVIKNQCEFYSFE